MTPNGPLRLERPLVVVEGPTGLLGTQVAAALAVARRGGWELVRGWTIPATRGRFVCSGAVRTPEDAGMALRAAAGGAGLVVAASAARATVDRLLADLRRLGAVQHVPEGSVAGAARLTGQDRALLGLLAEGLTVAEAGVALHLGAGAAQRRLATACRRAGVGSASAALAAALRNRG